jgi:NRPS condensation-like uncharacterized protein
MLAIKCAEYNSRIKKLEKEIMDLRVDTRIDIRNILRTKENKSIREFADADQLQSYKKAAYELDRKYFGPFKFVKLSDD